MKKQKLSADFEFNLEVIGVVAPVREYKLAWLLNEHLDVNFIKQDDLTIELKGNNSITISNFLFENDLTIFRLLKNRLTEMSHSNKSHLINSINQFDYLITVDDQSDNFDAEKFKNAINAISEVHYATRIDTTNLKEKENLII